MTLTHINIGVYSRVGSCAYYDELVSGEYAQEVISSSVTYTTPWLEITFTPWISRNSTQAVLVILDEGFNFDIEYWTTEGLPVEYAVPESLMAKPDVIRRLRDRYDFTNVWILSTREPKTLERCGVLNWLEKRIRVRGELARHLSRKPTASREPMENNSVTAEEPLRYVSIDSCFMVVAGVIVLWAVIRTISDPK